MNQFDIYEYTDENLKKDENCLTVDFYFTSDVSKDRAVQIVDNMVSDNDGMYNKLVSHRPAIFVKSPFITDSK